MDFLARIAPPVVHQPQAFSDAMLDPTSRGLWGGLTTEHMSGASLQATLRHSADQLQRTVQGQFVSLKVSNKSPCIENLSQGETINYHSYFSVGVCRPVLQILTLFQTKTCYFPHLFSDLAFKIHTCFQTWLASS